MRFTHSLSGSCLYETGDTLTGTIRVEKPPVSGSYTGTISFLIHYFSGS